MKLLENVRHEIVNSYRLDVKEEEILMRKLSDIIASSDKATLAREIREDFEQNMDSDIDMLYEAIVEHSDTWSDFIIEEFRRGFESAKSAANPANILETLSVLGFVKEAQAACVKDVVSILENNLTSGNPTIRLAAVVLLGDWVDDTNRSYYPTAVTKIQKRLQDDNWRIRHSAEVTLKDIGALPSGYSRSFWDSIRIYFTRSSGMMIKN